MRYLSLLCCLLLPAGAAAQNSYNWWDARKPAPVAPAPRPASAGPADKPAKKDTATSLLLTSSTGETARVVCLPSFPGGHEAFLNYLDRKLKRPKGPRQRGTMQVTFTVLASGAVSGAHVKPGNGLSPTYDEALVEVIGAMPKFNPGGCNGNATTMEVTWPVEFR